MSRNNPPPPTPPTPPPIINVPGDIQVQPGFDRSLVGFSGPVRMGHDDSKPQPAAPGKRAINSATGSSATPSHSESVSDKRPKPASAKSAAGKSSDESVRKEF